MASSDVAPPSIHYISHGWPSGYGVAARRLFLALHDLGVPLRWSPVEFDEVNTLLPDDEPSQLDLEPFRRADVVPDVVVLHSIPELLDGVRHLRPPGAAFVLHTVWEFDVLQAHWPVLINQFDGVIVPTQWNADTLRHGGVRVPIEVVPHVASTELPDATWLDRPPIAADHSFLCHSIASWSERKAPWLTVEAYARAFDSERNALMVLRTNPRLDVELPSGPGPADRTRLTSWAAAGILHRRHPTGRFALVTEGHSFADIEGLHRRSDCWVSLPRAEGWDLGVFDAATAGTPVITTATSGPLAYLDPEASILIPGSSVGHPFVIGARWIEPDLNAAVEALRAVRADTDEFARRAEAQAVRLRATYAPGIVARQFLGALARIGLA